MGPSTGYQMGVPHSSHCRCTIYRLVPGGLYDAGPNPQPALPQRLHFCSSCSSLLRTYCFWPRLRCTELGCILLFSFSPGDSLNQSPGSLFGSPAASFLWRPLGFAFTRLTPHTSHILLSAIYLPPCKISSNP